MIPAIFAVWSLALIAGFGWFIRDLTSKHSAQIASMADRIQVPEASRVAALEAAYGEPPRAATANDRYDDVELDADLSLEALIGDM